MPKDNNIDTCIKSPEERQKELIPEVIGTAIKITGSLLDGIENISSKPIADSNTIEDGSKFASKAGEKIAVMNDEERKCLDDLEVDAVKNSGWGFDFRSFLNFGLLAAKELVGRVEELPELETSTTPQMQQFMENIEEYNRQTHLKSADAMPKIESPAIFESRPAPMIPLFEAKPAPVVHPPLAPTPFLDFWNSSTQAQKVQDYHRASNIIGKKLGCTITWWEYEAMMKKDLDPSQVSSLRYVERNALCPNGTTGAEVSQGRVYPSTRGISFSGDGSVSYGNDSDGGRVGSRHNVDVGICLKDANGDFTDCYNDRYGHHTGPKF